MSINITSGTAKNYDLKGGSNHLVSYNGFPYAVVNNSSDGSIEVWKGNSATTPTAFSEQDSANNPAAGAGRYQACSCAISSAGIIRIIYYDVNGASSALRYVTFSCVTDTFAGDVSVKDIGGAAPSIPSTAMLIDPNGDVHAVWVDNVGGVNGVYYVNNIGGTWNTHRTVESVASCLFPMIVMPDNASLTANSPIPNVYHISTSLDRVRRGTGNLLNATSFSLSSRGSTVLSQTNADQRMRGDPINGAYIATDSDGTMERENSDSGVVGSHGTWFINFKTGESKFLAYEDANDDIAYIQVGPDNVWLTTPTVIETGTFNRVSFDSQELHRTAGFPSGVQRNTLLDDVNYDERGASFVGDGNKVRAVTCQLTKSGSPTGTAVARIYDHTGTFGSGGTPTGSVLAESLPVDISKLPDVASWFLHATFLFDIPFTLVNTTNYFVCIFVDGSLDASNYVVMQENNGGPYPGNSARRLNGGTWTAVGAWDLNFMLFTERRTYRDYPHYVFADETASPDILWGDFAPAPPSAGDGDFLQFF